MEVKTSQKFVVVFHNPSYFKNKIKMNTAAKTILVTFLFWKKQLNTKKAIDYYYWYFYFQIYYQLN